LIAGAIVTSPLHSVTDIREKSHGAGRFIVSIDGSPLGLLGAAAIAELELRSGASLDVRAMDRLRDAIAEQAAFDKAIELLTARPRSARELHRRLMRYGAGKTQVDAAIRRLTALGYLNDAALADALIRSKMIEGGASRRRVHQELFRKGVARDVADAAIEQAVEQ
jgi:regulatory protein